MPVLPPPLLLRRLVADMVKAAKLAFIGPDVLIRMVRGKPRNCFRFVPHLSFTTFGTDAALGSHQAGT
jgi:hypothetical protein